MDNLKPTGNQLEVEVTSVAANRIRDLDRRGGQWKIFKDINIVNVDYKPFDASSWPLTDCGLLGPVTLTAITPAAPLSRFGGMIPGCCFLTRAHKAISDVNIAIIDKCIVIGSGIY